MASEEFTAGVAELLRMAEDESVAVLCSESVWWRCHRRLLADHLVLVHDVVVEHLFHDGRLNRHAPTPEARRAGDHVVYDVGVDTPLFDAAAEPGSTYDHAVTFDGWPVEAVEFFEGDDDDVGPAFEQLVEGLRSEGLDVTAHDTLKTAPRGFSKDHPRIELLRMKGCIAWQSWEVGAWLGTPEPLQRVRTFLDTAAPLVEWLDSTVGPSELEDGWR